MKIITFALGLALGYVLGTRQGREGYDRLKRQATDLWNDPRTRRGVRKVHDAVQDSAPAATEGFDKVVGKIDDQATAATTAEELPGNV
jgi:hypothetical protein